MVVDKNGKSQGCTAFFKAEIEDEKFENMD